MFREVQRFRQGWIWVIFIATTLPVVFVLLFGAHQQLVLGKPFGDRPVSDGQLVAGIGLTFAILGGVVALLLFARLRVVVDDREIAIHFAPFHIRGKRIPLSEIAEARKRSYDPLMEYGGWGIRYSSKGWAYNVMGEEGVQLVLTSGKQILIGSQRSDELERAITSSQPAAHPTAGAPSAASPRPSLPSS